MRALAVFLTGVPACTAACSTQLTAAKTAIFRIFKRIHLCFNYQFTTYTRILVMCCLLLHLWCANCVLVQHARALSRSQRVLQALLQLRLRLRLHVSVACPVCCGSGGVSHHRCACVELVHSWRWLCRRHARSAALCHSMRELYYFELKDV